MIIFSKTVEKHSRNEDEILKALENVGVRLRINKCHFFQHTMEYLVHTMKLGELEIDHANTDLLHYAKSLAKKSAICQFLGFCNVYLKLIERFTYKAAK